MPLCEADEGAVRATLQKVAPNTRLIDRDDLVSQIKKHGLQEIDAFDSLVVTSIGSETGAESIVTMTLRWDGDHYQLINRVFPDSSVDMFSTYRTRVLSEIAGDVPVLLQDPDTGAFLAVPKRRTSGLGVFRYPQCNFSENPKNYAAPEGLYQEFRMRVTITDQGRVDQIAVMSPAPSFATEKTAESMRDAWRFTPAINSDGKPFPIRANLQIVFWQGRMTWHISY
jgi:hypothetical protein